MYYLMYCYNDVTTYSFKAVSVVNLPPAKTFDLISLTPGQAKRKIQKSIKVNRPIATSSNACLPGIKVEFHSLQ